MAKVAHLYGMTPAEAMQLSDKQVSFMLDHAETTATQLLANNASFQQALTTQLAPATRAVREQLGNG
jgi:hypothetical protein